MKYLLAIGVLAVLTLSTQSDTDIQSPIYQLIKLEHERTSDGQALTPFADHHNPKVRARLALTIGRIGDPQHVGLLERLLVDQKSIVRAQAAFALGQFDHDNARKLIGVLLTREQSFTVLRQAYKSLGFIGDESALEVFEAGLRSPATAGAAAQGLGKWLIFKAETGQNPSTAVVDRLLQLAVMPAPQTAPFAAFALSRLTELASLTAVESVVSAFQRATVKTAKLSLMRALGRFDHPQVAAIASEHAGLTIPYKLKVEALRALRTQSQSTATDAALIRALEDPNKQVAVQAVQILRNRSGTGELLAEKIPFIINQPSQWLQGEFLLTLAQQNRPAATPFIPQARESSSPLLQRFGVLALATNPSADDVSTLTNLLQSETTEEVRNAAEATAGLAEELVDANVSNGLAAAISTKDLSVLYYASEFCKRTRSQPVFDALLAVYPNLTEDGDVEAKVAVLDAIAVMGTDAHLAILESALEDNVKQVVSAAAKAYEAITGIDVSERVPVNAPTAQPLADPQSIRAAMRSQIKLTTSKGVVVMAMLPEAPLTAFTITKLAAEGFYAGKTFHRVVPHFVAQGGDPRGDGFGGLPYSIRDEVSSRNHTEAIVGIATAGKDTGSCQFFVNHGSNLHLDGRYTAFAKVIRGMEVVHRLEQGDVIIKSEIVQTLKQ